MLEKGTLLVSEPFLPDPNFERSVVLLCEHNEDGSVGFVLNHPCHMFLHDVIEIDDKYQYELYFGGPVEHQTLHYLHNIEELADSSELVCDNIYWGGNFEKLKKLIAAGKVPQEKIRFFVGYSGWQPGQLQKETQWDTWITTAANTQYIFTTKEPHLWQKVLKDMGGKFKMYSNYPIDPRLN
jgi:putative transcriptional regulator